MSNPLVLLTVAVLGLVGFFILLLVGLGMVRDEGKGKTPRPKASAVAKPTKLSAATAADPTARPAETDAGPVPAPGSAREVLRVLREEPGDRLVVEIVGARYASLDDIHDPILHDGLMTTLRDLQAFAGAAPGEMAARPAATKRPAAGKAPAGTLAAESALTAPGLRPSMNPFRQVVVLRELAKNQPPPPKSITEQVDEILQSKLAGSPHQRRGIHVRSGTKGAALFQADGKVYESVDEVPDEEVRGLIRAAVAEWEKSQ